MASTKIDKGLKISIPILVVVVVSAIVTTILMNNKSPNIDPELNQETSITNNNEKENKMTKKEKVQIIKEYLDNTYGDAPCTLDYDDPFQLLVATCLAAQCTDARVNMVTPALFKNTQV